MSSAGSGRVHGELPPPRVLFVWGEGDEEKLLRGRAEQAAAQLSDAITTSRIVSSEDLQNIHLRSFDMAAVWGDLPSLPNETHVVQFGGVNAGLVRVSHQRRVTLQFRSTSVATAWRIPDGLTAAEAQLVDSDLLRLYPRGNAVPANFSGSSNVLYSAAPLDQHRHRVLLEDIDGSAAVIVKRRDDGSQQSADRDGGWHWVLPSEATPTSWIRLALEALHQEDPLAFPRRTGWKDLPEYRTAAEQSAVDRVDGLLLEQKRLLARLTTSLDAAKSDLETATQTAESGIRRVVTSQGDELVDAVLDALTSLGFEVTRSDSPERKGDLLEDLVISPAGNATQIALAEVRGYARGAQLSDLQRIDRFTRRFMAAHGGQEPNRRWYVVNHFAKNPPSDRGRPLASNPNEVAEFAVDGGLVIGCPDLLKLCLQVERGERTVDEARTFLWGAVGYLEVGPPPG